LTRETNGAALTAAVVIPTFRREESLCRTIASVLNLRPQPEEIWVIDQTDVHQPDTDRFLERAVERGVKWIRLAAPGVCFARNLGAALAATDVIIYIDDDVLIEKRDFVAAHMRNYLDPRVAAVSGQIVAPNQPVTYVMEVEGEVPQNYGRRVERIHALVGANHSIRRDVILNIASYDESFAGRTYANEDGDLALRLVTCGCRIDFDPDASVVHLHAPTGGNRIIGRDDFPEWTRSVTFFQMALRHYRGLARMREFLKVFRTIAFRKEIARNPVLYPHTLAHALYGFGIALARHATGASTSLTSPGVDELRRRYGVLRQ
jgi:glycosyltransferase involved in cell wall biosynthesis